MYGNKERKLNYVLEIDDIRKVVNFVLRYGEENGFLLFVVYYVNDFLEILILLFVLMIKMDIYLIYKIVCEESYGRVVELLIFKGIWLMCIFYIKIVLFRLDVCLKCEKFWCKVMVVVMEEEKLWVLDEFKCYIEVFKSIFFFYVLLYKLFFLFIFIVNFIILIIDVFN